MPKVKMPTIGAGPGGTWQPGDEVEISDEQAALLPAGRYEVVDAPPVAVAEVDFEAEALMALSRDDLWKLATENGITGVAGANKTQLVAALRARGITIPQQPETAALAGGETAASVDAPQPRRRRRSEPPAAE